MMVYYLNEKTTSLNFYNEFMKKISDYFIEEESRKTAPIISLERVEWLDSRVIPNLICIGLILRDYYSSPIELKLRYNPSLLYFLENSHFFSLVGKYGLNIYTFDNDYIGGFDTFIDKKYRKCHKVEVFDSYEGFYQLNKDEQDRLKKILYTRLSEFDIPRAFSEVLSDVENYSNINKDFKELCISALSEIICNAMLYSGSKSFAYMQSNKYGTYISISDVGIGFLKSLVLKDMQPKLQKYYIENENNKLKNINLDSPLMEDFFILFDALQYSWEKNRVNLWRLKEIVVNNKGCFRIHSNNTQIIFSYQRCEKCRPQHINECIECIIDDFKSQKDISPLRFYTSKFKGVHIEIELYREEVH